MKGCREKCEKGRERKHKCDIHLEQSEIALAKNQFKPLRVRNMTSHVPLFSVELDEYKLIA